MDLNAPMGLQFRGQLVSPGAEFDPDKLPRPAVLLENGGRIRVSPEKSRYAFASLWILWRFCFDRKEWIEIVRTTSDDAGFSVDFAPIAHRWLQTSASLPATNRAQPLIDELTIRIRTALEGVTREMRCQVLAGLEQNLCEEIVRVSEPISIHRAEFGSYPRIGAQREDDEPGRIRPAAA